MSLYQVQAALVLEEVIWGVSLSSLHEWHTSQEVGCQQWPCGTATGKVLSIEYQSTHVC